MAERIVAKYRGKGGEYLGGIPARDLTSEDLDGFTDEQKATLAASTIYELRGDAPKDTAAAERRVERAETAAVKEGAPG